MKKLLLMALCLGIVGQFSLVDGRSCPSGMHPTIHAHNKDKGLKDQNKLCKKCSMPKMQCTCGH